MTYVDVYINHIRTEKKAFKTKKQAERFINRMNKKPEYSFYDYDKKSGIYRMREKLLK